MFAQAGLAQPARASRWLGRTCCGSTSFWREPAAAAIPGRASARSNAQRGSAYPVPIIPTAQSVRAPQFLAYFYRGPKIFENTAGFLNTVQKFCCISLIFARVPEISEISGEFQKLKRLNRRVPSLGAARMRARLNGWILGMLAGFYAWPGALRGSSILSAPLSRSSLVGR